MTAAPFPDPPSSDPPSSDLPSSDLPSSDLPSSDLPSSGEPPRADQPSWQPALPAPAAGVSQRQLRRSSTNKVLGGVCGGLAEYTNTDPVLWRVGFVALALMGAGIFIYPVLWLLVPAAGLDGSAASGLHETLRKGRSPRS